MLLCCFTTTRPEPLHTSLTLIHRLEMHEKWHTALSRAFQWLLPPSLHKGFAGLSPELLWGEGKGRECHMREFILVKFELWAVTPTSVNIFDFVSMLKMVIYVLLYILLLCSKFLGTTQDPWHIQVHNCPVSDQQILSRLQLPKPTFLQHQGCAVEGSNTCSRGHNHCLNSYSGLDPRELLLWEGLTTLQSKWPFETNQWFYSSAGVLKQQLLK